jgi:periplasmic protein TonB
MSLSLPLDTTTLMYDDTAISTRTDPLFATRYWIGALLLSILLHLFIMHGLPFLTQYPVTPMQQMTASFRVLAPQEVQEDSVPPLEVTPPPTVQPKPVVAKPLLQSKQQAMPEEFKVPDTQIAHEDLALPMPEAHQPTVATNDTTPLNTSATPMSAPHTSTANTQASTSEITTASPSATSQTVGSDLFDAYGRDLQRLCERNKQYPAIAIRRHLEGVGSVQVRFSASGQLLSVEIAESTGQSSLDEQALQMVKKSLAELPPPPSLKGQAFSLSIPIMFKLD